MMEAAAASTLTLKFLDEGLPLCANQHRAGSLANAYSCRDSFFLLCPPLCYLYW
jgi:hypothetical protein